MGVRILYSIGELNFSMMELLKHRNYTDTCKILHNLFDWGDGWRQNCNSAKVALLESGCIKLRKEGSYSLTKCGEMFQGAIKLHKKQEQRVKQLLISIKRAEKEYDGS